MTIAELHNELKNNVLNNLRGTACETWHARITTALREYLRKTYGADFSTYQERNQIAILYNGCVLYWIEIKRKKFAEFRRWDQSQFYYNDFVLLHNDESSAVTIEELKQRIDDRMQTDERIKQEQKQKARKILCDIMQAYNITAADARTLCRFASTLYDI